MDKVDDVTKQNELYQLRLTNIEIESVAVVNRV